MAEWDGKTWQVEGVLQGSVCCNDASQSVESGPKFVMRVATAPSRRRRRWDLHERGDVEHDSSVTTWSEGMYAVLATTER